MRALLDRLYNLCVYLAVGFVASICLLVMAQVAANIITKFAGRTLNITIPSYADFSGYFLASASFLALAFTLRSGKHIRVSLFTQMLSKRAQLVFELFALLCGLAVSLCATYYMARLCYDSYLFADMSPGIVAVPIFVPQLVVLAGLIVLSIAFIDTFVETLRACNLTIFSRKM